MNSKIFVDVSKDLKKWFVEMFYVLLFKVNKEVVLNEMV